MTRAVIRAVIGAVALSLVCGLCGTAGVTARATTSDDRFQVTLDRVNRAYAERDRTRALATATAGLAAARRVHAKLWIAAFAQTSGVIETELGVPRRAVALENEALALFRSLGKRRSSAQAVNALGVAYGALGRPADARRAYGEAIALYTSLHDDRHVGTERNNLGMALVELGRYREALRSFAEALPSLRAAHDGPGEAATLLNEGVVRLELGDYPQALRALRAARDIQHRSHDAYSEAGSLVDIALVNESSGAYAEALAVLDRALALARDSGNRVAEAKTLGTLGNIQAELGRFDEARANENAAIALDRALGDARGEARTLTNAGLLARELGRYDEAKSLFDASLAIDRRIDDPHGVADNAVNLAEVAERRGQYAEAVAIARQAAARYGALGDPTGEAAALVSAGIDEHRLGHARAAAALMERALARDRRHGNRLAVSADLGNLARIDAASGRLESALGFAREGYAIARKIGAPTFGNLAALAGVEAQIGRPVEAVAHFETALDEIEAQRRALARFDARRSFQASVLAIYDEYVRYLLTLHRRDERAGYDRRALAIFERKQARAFLEQVGQSAARRFAGVPEDVTAEDARVTLALAGVGERVASFASDPHAVHARLVALETERHALSKRRDALDARIRVAYPAYYHVTRPEPIDIAKLQHLVAPHQAMLVFDVADDQTALWIVRRDRLTVEVLDVGTAAITTEIAAFRRDPLQFQAALDGGASSFELARIADSQAFASASFALYRTLLPPPARAAIADADSLVIVPTGPLYEVPWSALVIEEPAVGVAPHYLLEDRSVSYLSSGSLLAVLREAQAHRISPRYPVLAFANPNFAPHVAAPGTVSPTAEANALRARTLASYGATSSGDTNADAFPAFSALPASETEARGAIAALRAPADSHPLLSGDDASTASVHRLADATCAQRTCLADYRYILFATHAVLPDEVRGLLQPALVLSHPDVDGFLTMGDVLGLRLNADVVSLSACNTGRGVATRADGVRGFTQAFMYAGTAAVSVTLWELDDRAAQHLTPAFYAAMARGEPPARALRSAQLAMLHGDDRLLRYPFFWAQTVLFGDGERAWIADR
ncbi:MAG: tetratricopeptide repeat protein [Vulcanimicrobiaceae bacterium]